MDESMIQTECINLKRLPLETRHKLAAECYHDIFNRIWDGVNYDLFFDLFFSKSDVEKLFLFRTNDRQLAGYFSFRVMNIELAKKSYAAIRLSTNILPKYQGQNLLHRLVFVESAKYFFKTLVTRQAFMIFFTSNSPASYCAFKRRARKTYPCPHLATPEEIERVMLLACERFKVPLTNQSEFVSSYSVRLRPEISQRMRTVAQEDEYYRFYLKRCPRYDEGQALVTMKPVTVAGGFIDIFQQVYRLTSKKLLMPLSDAIKRPLRTLPK